MSVGLFFDPELLARYDRPGPRYTSYPTAPQFHDRFGPNQFKAAAKRSNEDPIPRDLSLYVHVPYCFSPCFYCGCNRVITRDVSRARDYLQSLKRELDLVAPLFDTDRTLSQIHLGGGTPNFLRADELAELMAAIDARFSISRKTDRDFSIELDPRHVSSSDVEALAFMGFNRVSLGVQDFDREVQLAVNRLQTVEQTLEVIEACRRVSMRSINVDLIYGLPKQTEAGFQRTLDIITEVRPDRLAVYSYAHLPQLFKPQRQIDASQLPDPATKLRLLELAIDSLTKAGYRYIGMDHFALPNDELSLALDAGTLQRNFMGYTTHAATDLIGVGVSAISHIADTYSQNPRDLKTYEEALGKHQLPVWRGMDLNFDDQLRAAVIQDLMCLGEINIGKFERQYEINFEEYFADALRAVQSLCDEGLAEMDAGHIRVTARGRLLVRLTAACFDAYLGRATTVQYSKVV
ncbi:oxygen-independent coproporphyrinogen III oxidase [Ahniella affigens]|uniref:Coproporphyrinogen-III oxidase n=1 Tax=Ahniella affigens TaxID=2021234 RepID=A0A2P1PMP4_9GAMM|nr:oxygen-independent coproporphyrinogen III oxidase [Ahniella affigens]AVP96114.1 oxygen-independent coproporphyrinogen III oxidase [Ahniella affigens]